MRWSTRRSRYFLGDSIQPLLILGFLLIFWHLTRTATFMFVVSARCVPFHEFWFAPVEWQWPLAGQLALVFLLVFAWNAVAALDAGSRSDRAILILNAIALSGIALVWSPLVRHSLNTFGWEEQEHGAWNVTSDYRFDADSCDLAKPLIGRWAVVSTDLDPGGGPLPSEWIELKRDFTMRAAMNQWTNPVVGRWRLHFANRGWIDVPGPGTPWMFTVESDGLRLRTLERADLSVSEVALRRVTSDLPPARPHDLLDGFVQSGLRARKRQVGAE